MEHRITREELSSLLASARPPLLLEALPPKYFEDSHMPGARTSPPTAAPERAPPLAPDKAAPIFVYCPSPACQNSHIAAARLKQLGYTDVRVYAEGKQDWIGAGLPVEQGSAVAA